MKRNKLSKSHEGTAIQKQLLKQIGLSSQITAKRIYRYLLVIIMLGSSIGILSACGQQAALDRVTQLSGDGLITAAQMATMQGQTGTYSFNGNDNGIKYSWQYDAAQIHNPTDQKLGLAINRDDIAAVQRQAGNAPYGVSLKLADFELDGSPTITVTIPQEWHANRIGVFTFDTADSLDNQNNQNNQDQRNNSGAPSNNNQLRSVPDSSPKMHSQDGVTTVDIRITVAHRTLYVMGGNGNGNGSTSNSADGSSSDGDSSWSSTTENNGVNSSGSSGNNNTATSSAGGGSSQQSNSSDSQSSVTNSSGGGNGGAASSADGSFDVSVSIDASALLGHMNELNASKRGFVPANGIILGSYPVRIRPGQSVYDALATATRDNGIQLDAQWNPGFGSYYVRGINQLYELDAGSMSGWKYSVDGWSPNYGASSYTSLHPGSVIQWSYRI